MNSNHYTKPYDAFDDFQDPDKTAKNGIVYGLLKDIHVATKIAQAAKVANLNTHNFDRAEALMTRAKELKPRLVILDWDACEAEAFKVLKEMNQNADLKGVTNVGYLSGAKPVLMEEARRAGCHRVYQKTEFMKELPIITARCAA